MAAPSMEGPLAKQNPSAPSRYSVRTFTLDSSGLRFRGAQRKDGEAPSEHRIGMEEVASLAPGHGDAPAPEGPDFQIRLAHDVAPRSLLSRYRRPRPGQDVLGRLCALGSEPNYSRLSGAGMQRTRGAADGPRRAAAARALP